MEETLLGFRQMVRHRWTCRVLLALLVATVPVVSPAPASTQRSGPSSPHSLQRVSVRPTRLRIFHPGVCLSVELRRNESTDKPSADEASRRARSLKRYGILSGRSSQPVSIVQLSPPLRC